MDYYKNKTTHSHDYFHSTSCHILLFLSGQSIINMKHTHIIHMTSNLGTTFIYIVINLHFRTVIIILSHYYENHGQTNVQTAQNKNKCINEWSSLALEKIPCSNIVSVMLQRPPDDDPCFITEIF